MSNLQALVRLEASQGWYVVASAPPRLLLQRAPATQAELRSVEADYERCRFVQRQDSPHMTSPRDSLREKVEKVMRDGCKEPYPDCLEDSEHIVFQDAVAVAVEMIEKERARAKDCLEGLEHTLLRRAEAAEKALAEFREKWGHVAQCACIGERGAEFYAKDSHCAPAQVEEKG